MVTITLSGGKELQAALKAMGPKLEAEVGKAVTGTALELQGDVKKRIQRGPKTGAVYDTIFRTINGRVVPMGPRPGGPHQASAPGESPASDTGRLTGSIFFDTQGPLTATVGSRLVYALWLEYGTSRMAARPYFRPAVEAMRAKFVKRLEAAVRRATQ